MRTIYNLVLLICSFSIIGACSSSKSVKTPTDVQIVDGQFPDKEEDGTTSDNKENKTDEPVEETSEYTFDFVENNDLSGVLDIATSLDKPVFLTVGASWCVPCKLMQRDVFTHQPTADYFNTKFVNYQVDIDKGEGPDIKIIYDIKTLPVLLWLDGKGRVLHRKEGAAYHADLIKNAEIALGKRG